MSGTIGETGSKSGVPYKTANFIMAWAADDSWITPGAKVNFTSIEVDPEGCCDLSADTYTAPSTGIYNFWATFYCNNNADATYFYLYINGTQTDFMSAGDNLWATNGGDSDDDAKGTFSVNLAMNGGDNIYIHVDGDLYTGHSAWGGSRIG